MGKVLDNCLLEVSKRIVNLLNYINNHNKQNINIYFIINYQYIELLNLNI